MSVRNRLAFVVVACAIISLALPALVPAHAVAGDPAWSTQLKKKFVGKKLKEVWAVLDAYVTEHKGTLLLDKSQFTDFFTAADSSGDGTLDADEVRAIELRDLIAPPTAADADGAGGCKTDLDCPVGYHCHENQGPNGTCAKDGT